MPRAKLNVRPLTTSQPPHRAKAARVRSVRGACRVIHSTAARRIRAAGISHEIWPPKSALNSRSHPVGPHCDTAPPLPPTLPGSLPVSRPKPL